RTAVATPGRTSLRVSGTQEPFDRFARVQAGGRLRRFGMSVAKTFEQEFLQPGDNLGLFRGDIGELTRIALQLIEPNGAARRGVIRLIAIGALAPARANNKFVAIGLYAGFFVLEV